jgi:hypothetical protein
MTVFSDASVRSVRAGSFIAFGCRILSLPIRTFWRDWVQLGFFFYLVCEAIGTAVTPGLFCQPRVIVKMIVEKQMECILAGEPEVQRRKPAPAPLLSITKSHMTRPGFEPGPPRWEAGD